MIQRQQTLWLLLATVAAILSFLFPFITGKFLVPTSTGVPGMRMPVLTDREVTAASSFLVLLLTGLSAALSGFTIFQYKNRPLQMKLCISGILLATGIIVLYIMEVRKYTSGTLALASVLPFIVLLSYFLAYRNIRKDEKLVKSLDKLR
jgi:hypothetical protein